MRILIKILLFPFSLLLTIVVTVSMFAVERFAGILNVLSGIMFITAVAGCDPDSGGLDANHALLRVGCRRLHRIRQLHLSKNRRRHYVRTRQLRTGRFAQLPLPVVLAVLVKPRVFAEHPYAESALFPLPQSARPVRQPIFPCNVSCVHLLQLLFVLNFHMWFFKLYIVIVARLGFSLYPSLS